MFLPKSSKIGSSGPPKTLCLPLPLARCQKGKLETLQMEGPLSHYRSWARSRCLVGGMMPLGRIITLGWQSPFSWLDWAGCSHGTQHMLGDMCFFPPNWFGGERLGSVHGVGAGKAGTSKNGSNYSPTYYVSKIFLLPIQGNPLHPKHPIKYSILDAWNNCRWHMD